MNDKLNLKYFKKRLEERLESIIGAQNAGKDKHKPVVREWMPCSSKPCPGPHPIWQMLKSGV